MSIADWDPSGANPNAHPLVPKAAQPQHNRFAHDSAGQESGASLAEHHRAQPGRRPLHRLAVVRRQQGVSLRNMARRLDVEASQVSLQEQETTDLPLSILYAWQKILEVPVSDLLVDTDGPLSPPVLGRARMVKLMKTAAAIMEKAQSNSLRRLVTMLIEQLVEIMPELQDVSPWHTVGQRRTLDDYGRVVERQLPDDLLRRTSH
jgi:transcriptional regulator with XRE-family HTH domain